jgi:phage terminase large subunit-like protein
MIEGIQKLSLDGYLQLHASLEALPVEERIEAQRKIARKDLFYLLRFLLGRADVHDQWLLDRTWEVMEEPNERIDLWAREHYKSTIITFAMTIQDILSSHGDDPDPRWGGIEVTVGIFSHTRPIAKKFLRQIKREFEENSRLKELFPDVLWANPEKEAPIWSMDDGIVLRRKTNPKEATVEAWGLVDSQPTGAHFFVRVYDDVVTRTSVQTPDAIKKTTEAWELSLNLAQRGGYQRIIGTRYHFNDTYATMISRGVGFIRRFPATEDGKPEGKPVFLDRESLRKKRIAMGSYTFACQMLQDPKGDETNGFNLSDVRYYKNATSAGMNVYMLVDPAHGKKKANDYTALMVVGMGADGNKYILDMVRDRLNLTERGQLVMDKHREWQPIAVGYERYGLQADIEHIYSMQDTQNYRFAVQELGGILGNEDRVRRMIPDFEQNRWYLPHILTYVDYEGKTVDMVKVFLEEELVPFPVGVHVDMMDAMSRIHDEDMGAVFPKSSSMPANVTSISSGYKRRAVGQATAANLDWVV